MTFKELLISKKITGYALAKNTRIPYTTINDLIIGKTIIQNTSLKHAISIADYLRIDVRSLMRINTIKPIKFRYFRNNVLHELKRLGPQDFVLKTIREKLIDYYYKNNCKEYAYYLLALIDYLCDCYQLPKFERRYNDLRKEKLEHPFFVGSDLVKFDSIEDAEEQLNIKVIPEFRKYNIIEGDVYNVA